MKDNLKVKGRLILEFKNAQGEVVARREDNNLVVQTGLNYIAQAILNPVSAPIVAMALGEGTNPALLTDTALQAELIRQPFTTTNITGSVVTVTTSFSAGAVTGTITEAGTFTTTGAVSGVMFSRIVFAPVNLAGLDSITGTWVFTVS